jgi:hypothetical protein
MSIDKFEIFFVQELSAAWHLVLGSMFKYHDPRSPDVRGVERERKMK